MLNYYLTGINQVPIVVQTAAGVYKYDRYVPLIEAVLNLIISIILAQYIGILGVLVGTFVSYLLPLIIKPFVVFKYVFEKNVINYFKTFIKQLFVLSFAGVIVWILAYYVSFDSLVIQVIYNFVISMIIPTIVIILFYYHTEEFISSKDRIKFIFNKIRK